MRAIVLSIGTEILRGDILDTNAQYLARELSQAGFTVTEQISVGDDLGSLGAAIDRAFQAADVVVATGGLGPTEDDLTREAIAAVLDEPLSVDEGLVEQIVARFARMNRHMPARNRKQAALIPSATSIPNPNGTAPGWLVRARETTLAVMPGPPGEMRPMWETSVLPLLLDLLPGCTAMQSLMTFGLGESAVEERIDDVLHRHPEVTVATYAKSNGVQVHVTARARGPEEARALLRETEGLLRDRLGDAIFGTGDSSLAEVVGTELLRRGHTLAVMESASGGALSSLITDVPGSSRYFLGGTVAYTERTKAANGVDRAVMREFGLISRETAAAMAAAACHEMGADVGLGVTGIAGGEPVEGKDPGTCYVAVRVGDRREVREIHRPGPRETAKHFFAQCALDLARRVLSDGEGAQ